MTRSDFCALPQVWQTLGNCGEPICIYGTGDAAERILAEFDKRKILCSGIFASDGFVRDREFAGFKVRSLAQLENEFGKFTVVCAFGSQLPDVMAQVENIASRHRLLMPDLPIAGDEFFTLGGLLERFESYERVRDLLADDLSREVLDAVLRFKVTGEIDRLSMVFTDPTDDILSLVRPQAGDIYADLGAYNGDTCERFAELCPQYERMIAFEPDKRSFRKCVKRLSLDSEKYDNITFVNACAWKCDGSLIFSQSAGRQSQISASGERMQARSLDSAVGKNGRCDVIKYDVEGAEKEAIYGSVRTILNCRPRLQISAYHRPYDILELTEQLLGIYGGYKIYLRQPPYYPAWDTTIFAV